MPNDPSSPPRHFVGRVDVRGRCVDAFPAPDDPDAPATVEVAIDHPEGTWLEVRHLGHLIEDVVLATADSALATLYTLAADVGMSPIHSESVRRESHRWLDAPGIDDPSLVDRTDLPLITIDEPTSRDLDQAVFVEATFEGYVVWYAIADAAHFAPAGSALFDAALDRGATYYLPGLTLPMLPRALSEDLCSLGPNVDRRALLFRVVLDRRARVLDTSIERARVRSRLKTSYDAVQRYYDTGVLDHDDGLDQELLDAVTNGLDQLEAVGRRRMDLAAVRDTVRLYRTEIRVRMGDDGLRFVALADPRNDAERYNEQISLLCNVEGARRLARGGSRAQGVFRYHRPPGGHDLHHFARQIGALVRRHRLDPALWSWKPGGARSLAHYLAELPRGGDRDRLSRAIHRQALLAAGRSGFDVAPGIHHGVGADAYARFTAPMREVVGVFVHKETWELLGDRPAGDDHDDELLRQRVLAAAERARGTQRRLDSEVNRRVLDSLFEADRREGRERTGTVMGVARNKVHVQLDDPPIDVKIYRRHLEDQFGRRLRAGRDGVSLRRTRGGFAEVVVGDAVRVRPVGHDADRDRWRLELFSAERS
ncbi:MAG: RNB domain-containing ribonuclease [Acidobacteriota bacterium]